MRSIFKLAFAVVAVGNVCAAEIAGTWRGDSPCVEKDTACHDEEVAYRFTKEGKGTYSVSADKIVDGKPVNMGTLEFRYDEAQHLLTCEYGQGVWRSHTCDVLFAITSPSTTMTGFMIL